MKSRLHICCLLLLLLLSCTPAQAAFPVKPPVISGASLATASDSLDPATPVSGIERWALKTKTRTDRYQKTMLNGFAIGALAGAGLGLAGFFFVEGWLMGIGGIAAVILGIAGLSRQRKQKGLAWAALILGIAELLVLGAVLLLIMTL